jgi:hypothetical protein
MYMRVGYTRKGPRSRRKEFGGYVELGVYFHADNGLKEILTAARNYARFIVHSQ